MALPLGNVVQLYHTEPGGWLTAQARPKDESVRERVGRHVSSALATTAGMGVRITDPFRLLSADQLWLVYTRTPDVRAAIDGITRRIATWVWTMEVEDLPSNDPAYKEASEAAENAKRFLQAPTVDGETWQELCTKVVTDILVFEQGVIEEVYDKLVDAPLSIPGDDNSEGRPRPTVKIPATGAKLAELVALHGASVEPMRDAFGRVYGYCQDVVGTLGYVSVGGRLGESGASIPYFSKDQIVSISLFPNTSGRTTPLIETVVNEVITLMRSSEHVMLAVDADEIPPGILVLTGVAGKAAEMAKTDLQRLRGKDHKIRVITNPDPKGSGANWVELRRTPKDLMMLDVVRQVRRTIWRVFGVMPIEMGDTEDLPRAVGEVQLDAGNSHLIDPILNQIEAKVNARIVPVLVGEKFARFVKLRFDREAHLSPEEQKDKADALTTEVREGLITRNEARKEQGRDPLVGGDIATITLGDVLQRVDQLGQLGLVADGDDPPDDPPDDDGPDPDPDTGPGEAEGDAGAEGDDGPGEAGRGHHHGPPVLRVLRLPSEWPDAEKFEDYRTLDLNAIAESVSKYTAAVEPLYAECSDEVLAGVSALYDNGLRPEEAQRALTVVDDAIRKLHARWSVATAPVYVRTAQDARDRATDYAKTPVLADWRERGEAYGSRAMGFLTAPGGLLSDLRAGLNNVLTAVGGDPAARSADHRAIPPVPPDIVPGVGEGRLLSALFGMFEAAKHRIENWAGKLVELANETMAAGMAQGAAESEEWFYEWVAVKDDAICETCSVEGAAGFRPVSQQRVFPGGSTRCRARCRCVTVFWTRAEVQSGVAVPLSELAPKR